MSATTYGLLALWLPAAAGWAPATAPRPKQAVARSAVAVAQAADAPLTSAELKDELLDLLGEVVNRGIDAPPELAEDLLEIAAELGDASPVGDWPRNPILAGSWKLRYTSSKTFANNEGLSGYARDIAGVSTPELFMRVDPDYGRLTYVEPLELESGSLAAMFGKFANAEAVEVECEWSQTANDVMRVNSQVVKVGGNSWEPADRQDKAVRALGAGLPIFLDQDLFLLRCQPDYIVWVFSRA